MTFGFINLDLNYFLHLPSSQDPVISRLTYDPSRREIRSALRFRHSEEAAMRLYDSLFTAPRPDHPVQYTGL